jgi:hypothetical protein
MMGKFMPNNELQFGHFSFLRTVCLICLATTLAATSGCGDKTPDEEAAKKAAENQVGLADTPNKKPEVANKDASEPGTLGKKPSDSIIGQQPPANNQVPDATNAGTAKQPATPKAAVIAALSDAQTRLKTGDLYGYIERYLPLEEYVRLRGSKDHLKDYATDLALSLSTSHLIDALGKAQQGTIEFNETGTIATVRLPKEEPKPIAPGKLIAAPVLTNAQLAGWGSDLPKVITGAIAALDDGETKAFVANMFPASELRHPDAAAHLVRLEATLKSQPIMITQMKSDLALLDGAIPKMEDEGKTAVFEIAGKAAEIGRTRYKVKLPNRTFKFQLVEGSWRFYDHSPQLHAEIARQSALTPPDLRSRQFEGEYIQLERLGDAWRLGEIRTNKLR